MHKIFLAFLISAFVAAQSFAQEEAKPVPITTPAVLPEIAPAKPPVLPEAKPPETILQPKTEAKKEEKVEEKKPDPDKTEPKKAEPKKAEPKKAEPKKTAVMLKAAGWFSNIDNAQRMAISFDGRLPKYSTEKANGKITLKFDTAVDYAAPDIRASFKDSFTKVESANKPHLNVTVSYNPDYEVKVSQHKTKVYVDVINKNAKSQEKPTEEKKEEAKKEEPKKDEKISFSLKIETQGTSEVITATFASPTPMAAFNRFGYFWLVFDSSEKKEFKNELLKKSTIFENVEKIQADAQVFRLTLKKDVQASVKKLPNGWQAVFDPTIKFQPINPLNPQVVNTTVTIPAKNVGKKVVISDDFTGDELQIITILDEGSAVTATKETNDLFFEKTVQGVVYRNYGNAAQFAVAPEGIVISKAAVAVQPINKGSRTPLFKFENWKQYSGAEFSIQRALARAKGGTEYGKFLFSQKLYNEAANYLVMANDFDSQFLAAAAQFLNGKPDVALELFSKITIPAGRDEDEFALWKIAAEFEMLQQQYEKTQALELPAGFTIPKNIANYPPYIAEQLLLDLAERKISDGDIISAQEVLNQFPKSSSKNSVNYKEFLQGLIFDKSNKRARAKEIWDKLALDYSDRKTRAHALYYSASQDYELGRVNAFDTAKALDKIRIIWRGDRFEYQLLKKLGDIYLASANNIGALRTYREAVIHFPKHPDNEVLTERMRVAYANALTKDLSTPDKAFQAVALYYEFEELKPAGEDGDKITGELAEKLADFDLLKEAAELMEKSLDKILDPEDRILNATRVAIMYYINRQPKAALEMLNKSEAKQIPAYIQQERDVLAVNAMLELGQADTARKLISKLSPERAAQINAEILWKDKQWREMLAVYNQIPDKTAGDIMKMAIAKAMIDDKKGLAELTSKYSELMSKSEYADLFKFTADSGSINYKNLPASLNLDSARKLIDIYKVRLKSGGVDALAPDKNNSAQSKK